MRGIGEGEQEADADGLRARVYERARRPRNSITVECFDDLAAIIEPAADFMDHVARQKHFWRGREQIEHVVAPPLPADLVNVAEAHIDDEAGADAFVLEQCVQRRRRAVQDQAHALGAELCFQVFRDPFHHAHGVARIGIVLGDECDLARVHVKRGHVGECAADVDSNANAHGRASVRRRCVAAASTFKLSSSATQ